jgi:hypothetical protein
MSSSAHFSTPSTISVISNVNNLQFTLSAFISTAQEHKHTELAHYGHPQAFNYTTEVSKLQRFSMFTFCADNFYAVQSFTFI